MGVIRQGYVRMEIAISPDLHKRLKTMCKQKNLKMIELIRDSLSERLEFLEEKQRREEERLRAEREASSGRTKFTGFKKMSPSNLPSPAKPIPLGEKAPTPDTAKNDSSLPMTTTIVEKQKELPTEYTKYAEKIREAVRGGSPLEARLCTVEAVSAIKKRYPLTHPRDDVIVSILEKLVVEEGDLPTIQTRKEVPEIVIDTSKIKTSGDVSPVESDS